MGAVNKERDGLANALDHARDPQQAAAQLAEAKHVPTAGDPSWFDTVCRLANVMRPYL
ncbi:MAG: hypothetical protein Q8N13_08720 [Acidovorax sp.]|nr:hypothetical protein [Acidovorax sp.]